MLNRTYSRGIFKTLPTSLVVATSTETPLSALSNAGWKYQRRRRVPRRDVQCPARGPERDYETRHSNMEHLGGSGPGQRIELASCDDF